MDKSFLEGMPKFQNPDEELEFLREQVARKEQELKSGFIKPIESNIQENQYDEQTVHDIEQYNELLEKLDILQ